MLAWVFLRNVSEVWRIGARPSARHDEGESYHKYCNGTKRSVSRGNCIVELIIKGYNELSVVVIILSARNISPASASLRLLN